MPAAAGRSVTAGPLLDIRNLTVRFRRNGRINTAVADLSYTLNAGETLALVGESGSGKSVSALALTRLLPPSAQVTGAVILHGVDLLRLSQPALRAVRGGQIAMVFQEPMSALNPVLTIGEQIIEAIRTHRPVTRAVARKQAASLLDDVGIADAKRRLNDYQHHLSGGMRQRAMIAIALSCDPQVLIADEPTTALDVTIQVQILALIRSLQVERGLAVLLITHDLGVAAETADRAAVMYAGRIVETAPTPRLLSSPLMPYTRGLLASVPQAGGGGRLQAIPGQGPDPFARPHGCAFGPRCVSFEPRCDAAMPPLEPVADGHGVRCRRWRTLATAIGPTVRASSTGAAQRPTVTHDPLLDMEAVSKSYPLGRRHPFAKRPTLRALDSVSLSIARGEALGLVGESGSGKTTLGRVLLRLIQPTSGTVRFDGIDMRGLSGRALRSLRRRLQPIFQDPLDSLNPRRTVAQTIGEAMVIHGLAGRRERRDRIADLLGQVGLSPDHMHLYPHEFSGGQRQRIGIARALAGGPDLLVADEPVSALDISVQAQIVNLLGDLRSRLGLTLLLISHDLSVVEHMCDRVAVLYLGRIVEVLPANALRAAAHPYTQALVSAAPALDLKARRARIVLAGEVPSASAPPSGCAFRTRCPIAAAICAEQVPPLRAYASGRFAACHLRTQPDSAPQTRGARA